MLYYTIVIVILYHITLFKIMSFYVYDITLHHLRQYITYITLCYIISYYVMFCFILSYYKHIIYYFVLYHVILYCILYYMICRYTCMCLCIFKCKCSWTCKYKCVHMYYTHELLNLGQSNTLHLQLLVGLGMMTAASVLVRMLKIWLEWHFCDGEWAFMRVPRVLSWAFGAW